MKAIHIIGIVVLGVAIAVVISMYNNSSEYVSFDYASELAVENPNKKYHIVTVLNEEKPMHYDPRTDANYFEFYAIDSLGVERKVVYRKPKPQDFERTDKIVLEGYDRGTHFEATNILLKCPSKYQEDPTQGKLEEQ
jgi:cytochrome c-type biogenesis protein CcmE